MPTYKKTIVRLGLLSFLAASAALLSTMPARAATCQQTCMAREQACAASCGDKFNA